MGKEDSMKKKVVGIVVGLVVVAAVAAGGIWYFFGRDNTGSGKDKVYVQSVAEIVGRNNGFISSYNGVVESQETLKVNCDQERKVKDILVSVGDTVEEGTALPLLEAHAAGDQTVPVHHHLVRHHHHTGAGALQAGHLRFHIRQAAHLTVEGIQPVGGKFHRIFVIHVAGLNGPDGYDHIFHHFVCSSLSFKFP